MTTKSFTPEERERLINRALTRPKSPHVRDWSAGLWQIANQLGLEEAQPHFWAKMTWLLDERVPLDTVRSSPEWPKEEFERVLAEYAFGLRPAILRLAQNEVQLTREEMEAAQYDIEPKPDDKPDAGPEKKS